jgi:hypothetical protein
MLDIVCERDVSLPSPSEYSRPFPLPLPSSPAGTGITELFTSIASSRLCDEEIDIIDSAGATAATGLHITDAAAVQLRVQLRSQQVEIASSARRPLQADGESLVDRGEQLAIIVIRGILGESGTVFASEVARSALVAERAVAVAVIGLTH